MAKYLDQAGITVLVGQITSAYDERYAAISHTHTTANVISLGGYSTTSVSGTTLTDTDSLNAALKKLYNLSSSKLSTIPISTRSVLGGIKVGKHYTGAATFSPVATDPATAPTINSVSTTAGRYYAVETDSNGLAFVNVPWVDYNTTYNIATATTPGLVKPISVITKPTINSATTTAGKYYHVQMSSDGNMFVNVPWTDTKNAGTVTSVAMTVPTGLVVSGSPITSAGTLALTFAPGYSIPETSDQANWDTAFGWGNHASAGYLKSIPRASNSVLGGIKIGYATSGKNYAVQLDEETGAAFVNVPWTDTKNPGTVTSITLTQGTGITVSNSGTAITSSGTRTISLKQATSGELGGIKIGYTESGKNYPVELDSSGKAFVNVPWVNTTYVAATTSTAGLMSAADKSKLDGIAAGATANKGTVTSVAMTVPTGLTVSGSPITSAGTLALSLTAGYSIPTTAKQTNWDTAFGWGNHASAGYLKSIPQASNSVLGGIKIGYPTAGKNYAVQLDEETGAAFVNVPWTDTKNPGTVTSVAMTVPTGLVVSGSPITSAGTLALTFASGYSIPTTAKQTNWDTAYGWGDHSKAGYTKNTGTVTSITLTQGAGITVSSSGTAITTSGTRTISLNTATNTAKGGFMPWMSHTAASTYNGGSSAPAANATVVNVNAISTTAGKYYAIETDSNGRAFVNVPWTDSNTNYYPTAFAWTNGTTAGPTGSLTGSGMSPVSFGAIPSASASASGVVTTASQTFGGTKTLTAVLLSNSTATTHSASDDSTKVATTAFVHDAITNDITALSETEIQSAVEAALAAL